MGEGGVELEHHSFLITAFEGYDFSPSKTAAFLQGKYKPVPIR